VVKKIKLVVLMTEKALILLVPPARLERATPGLGIGWSLLETQALFA
jgi:hypothetical protein